MISNHDQLATPTERARNTIQIGKSLAIVGWTDLNHTVFTRSLPKDKVVFFGSSPRVMGRTIGFVLFSRYIKHKVSERIKEQKEVHPIVLEPRQIKKILESCQNLFVPDVHCSDKGSSPQTQSNNCAEVACSESLLPDTLLDFLTQPQKEIPMNEFQKFAVAFKAAASSHPQLLVGSRTVGEIRKSSGVINTNPQLVIAGWMEPVIGKDKQGQDKSKIGWYKAGRLMAEVLEEPEVSLPDTPAERAEFLISQEAKLLAEKGKLEARQAEIDKILETIAAAKKMFSEIDKALNI